MITFPAFASSWLGTPSLPPSNAGGLSILAYSGGGGSAKTGVFNLIHVSSAHQLSEEERQDDANADEYGVVKNEFRISTGDEVGVGVALFRPHNAKKGEGALLAAAVGNEIRVYRVPISPDDLPGADDDDGVGAGSDEKENAKHLLLGSVHVGDGFGCNAVSWSPTGNAIAVGCENGRVRVYMVLPTASSAGGGSGPSLELKLASDCEDTKRQFAAFHITLGVGPSFRRPRMERHEYGTSVEIVESAPN